MNRKGLFSKFGFFRNAGTFQRLGASIDNGFFIKLTVIGTIILTCASAFLSSYSKLDDAKSLDDIAIALVLHPVLWMLIGGLALLLGSVGSYRDQKNLRDYTEELARENDRFPELDDKIHNLTEALWNKESELRRLHEELVTTHLKAIFKSLELSTHDRVSIYYEHGNEFYLLARYSANPEYAKKHRQKFALNQGVISYAWQHMLFIEEDCPNYEKKEPYYEYMQKRYGFSQSQIESFAMKSCRYVAIAISDADCHTGVIVFESTDVKFLDDRHGDRLEKFKALCLQYQGIHSKFLRDGLSYNREVKVKPQSKPSVDQDIINTFDAKGDMQ